MHHPALIFGFSHGEHTRTFNADDALVASLLLSFASGLLSAWRVKNEADSATGNDSAIQIGNPVTP